MLRTRNLISAAFGTLLLVVMAGPAQAGPAPVDDGSTSGGGGTPATPPTSSGSDLWSYVGYAAAVLAVIAVVMVASIVLTRQSHRHAAHPA
jgi:hypothetical protein